MQVHNVEQGGQEWNELRCGVLTASTFGKILTPKTQKPSSQVEALAQQLALEEVTGGLIDEPELASYWMERGVELENEAVQAFEFEHDQITQKVGFITNDDGTVGCSPDRLIGKDALLEIKCPKSSTQFAYTIDVEKLLCDYYAQIQGQLMITGRKECTLYSYHPNMLSVAVTIQRDETYIDALQNGITQVLQRKQELVEQYCKIVRLPHNRTN